MQCKHRSLCLIFLFLWLSVSSSADTRPRGNQQNNISKAALDAADDRRINIEKELEQIKSPEWAGNYYSSHGLGFNFNIIIAPTSGFIYTWQGCLGLYDLMYGQVIRENERVKLHIEYSNNSRDSHIDEIELFPVRWGERHYIIFANQMVDFCNAVNSGMEPDARFRSRFLLKKEDEEKQVEGKPSIPAQYQEYLLSEPVNASILVVRPSHVRIPYGDPELSFRVYPVTLNAGRAEGIKIGMELHTYQPRNLQSAKIIKVEEHSSKAEIIQSGKDEKPPKAGWKMSTLIRQS
jgi:hypothetical protein